MLRESPTIGAVCNGTADFSSTKIIVAMATMMGLQIRVTP